MSRSIGDAYLKKPDFSKDPLFRQFASPIPLKRPVMSSEPSIKMRQLEQHDLFLIFASDGLWEQLTDQTAVDIVLKNRRSVSSSSFLNLVALNLNWWLAGWLVSNLICRVSQSNSSKLPSLKPQRKRKWSTRTWGI